MEKPAESSESKSSPQIHIQEMAVFMNNRLIGILDPEEAKGFLWLINKIKGDTVVIPYLSAAGEQEITLDIVEGKSRIIPHITDGGITMEIVCTGQAALREVGKLNLELKDLNTYRQLEQEAAKILKARVEQTIARAQQGLKADFIGFANKIHNHNPVEWNRIRKDWEELFPAIKSDVAVQVSILKMGKTRNPAMLRDNEE